MMIPSGEMHIAELLLAIFPAPACRGTIPAEVCDDGVDNDCDGDTDADDPDCDDGDEPVPSGGCGCGSNGRGSVGWVLLAGILFFGLICVREP